MTTILGGVDEAGGDEDGHGRAEDCQQDVHADFEWRHLVGVNSVVLKSVSVCGRRASGSGRVETSVRDDRFADVALVVLQRDVRQVVVVVLVGHLGVEVVDGVRLLSLDLDEDVGVGDGQRNVGRRRLDARVDQFERNAEELSLST